MAVEWLRVSLRGHGYGSGGPTGDRFFEQIGASPGDGFELDPSDGGWKTARVEFLSASIEDCQPGTERYEEFEVRLDAGLKKAAGWLNDREPTAFEQWRAAGWQADVFIGGWMNSDQFDLTLPPEFLSACGRLGLPITICTND
ncbi:MAG: hypothetical protein K2X82_20550 [Gemmataceae bacterium]|nr:hypothetical protein [Gemmataceae bacterium]